MSRARLAARAVRLSLTRPAADPAPDYDFASQTYDETFTALMGGHAVALLDRLDLAPGTDVVELACGTGHLTEQVVIRQNGLGSLRAVEKSAGMLAVARAKVGPQDFTGRVDWHQADMLEFLRGLPSASADVVICGWAICYTNPVHLLRQAKRVLRPGGRIGVIESTSDALGILRHAFEEVVAADPSLLTAMTTMKWPKNGDTLGRWMRRAGLSVEALWSGAEQWPLRAPQEAFDWAQRSAAGAGFRNAFDMSRETQIRERFTDALRRRADPDGAVQLVHPFVAGVATRDSKALLRRG